MANSRAQRTVINLPNGDSILAIDIAGIRCNPPRETYLGGSTLLPSVQIKHLDCKFTCIDFTTHAEAQIWAAMLNAVWQGRVTL